jgi:serine/threonine protein kinase
VEHIMEVTGRTFSENQGSYILSCLVKGLAYLHANKVLHRDIKSANLLVNPLAEVKLADFGIARLLENNVTFSTYGTPHWMAPEIWAESGYDYAADIWSLGITAYECVEGEPPYEDVGPMAVYLQIKQKGAPRFANTEDYSPEFVNFVYACLEVDPKKRPTAPQLLEFPFIANAQNKDILMPVISIYMEEAKKLALQAKEEKETASQADGPTSKHGTRRTTKKLIKTNTKTATMKGTVKKGETTVIHAGASSATMVIHSTPATSGPSGTVQIKKDPTPAPAPTASPSKQTMVVKNATVVVKK